MVWVEPSSMRTPTRHMETTGLPLTAAAVTSLGTALIDSTRPAPGRIAVCTVVDPPAADGLTTTIGSSRTEVTASYGAQPASAAARAQAVKGILELRIKFSCKGDDHRR